MKIFSLLFLILFITNSVESQELTNSDIIGVYSQPHSNPEGGETLIVFPDNTYVIVYFGGFQKGKWILKSEKIQLEKITEPVFALYGRKQESLKHQTRINFHVDSDNEALVSLNSKTIKNLRPVFNTNANCFDYPYQITLKNNLNHLQAAQLVDVDTYDINQKEINTTLYDFKNLEGFNDYILVNLPYEYITASTIEATYRKEVLYFDYGLGEMRKSPLESIDAEELESIKNFIGQNILSDILKYGDELFPFVENPTVENSIPFQRIDAFQVSLEYISIEKKSWFTANCNED